MADEHVRALIAVKEINDQQWLRFHKSGKTVDMYYVNTESHLIQEFISYCLTPKKFNYEKTD